MYRSLDPAFNIRKNIEFVLEHGIEEKFVSEYVNEMQNYFYRKKLQFGDVKTAFALDENYNKLYEVIYVELIDNLVNLETGKSISYTVDTPEGTIYPNSISNMRAILASKFKTDNYLQPKFMKLGCTVAALGSFTMRTSAFLGRNCTGDHRSKRRQVKPIERPQFGLLSRTLLAPSPPPDRP